MVTAHCLVKNEENFIWYSIMSVINYVDKIIVWDTGSTDKTVEIIKSIKNPKISFEEKGNAEPERISNLRQEMLDKTDSDWIMILDGDEIWHEKTISETINLTKHTKSEVIIHPVIMLIGDIYHIQEKEAGKYNFGKKQGHYNLRFLKNTKNLKVSGLYPNEAFVNKNGIKLQEISNDKIFFSNQPYLHASHLNRSSKDFKKVKYEIGDKLPLDYFYPEVFFKKRPSVVPNIWKNMNLDFKMLAAIETPLKKIKRKFI